MKIKGDVENVDMGTDIISVPVGEGADQIHGVIRLNKEGQEIIDLLKKETSKEQIVSHLASKYENDPQTLECWVTEVLDILQNAGLIEE